MKTGVLANKLLQYLYHHSPSRQSYVFVFLQFLLGTKALKPKLTAANYTPNQSIIHQSRQVIHYSFFCFRF